MRAIRLIITLGALAVAAPALAQPADLPLAAATTDQYPAGVRVTKTPAGPVYANARGQVLYGLDLRTVLRWSPDPAQYCQAECAKDWEPLLAPAGSKPNVEFPLSRAPVKPGYVSAQGAPDWSIITGPAGPQWVYKGWHMVYVRKGAKPGTTVFDGADSLTWNTLKFVPPVPKIVAPLTVSTVLDGGAYAFADKDGRVLFTGVCASACAGWRPLAAGMASRAVGDWSVSPEGDQPHWLYRGKPVFVSSETEPATVPAGATILRP